MNTLVTPTWLLREGVVQFIQCVAPELLPVVASMPDDKIAEFSRSLAQAFAGIYDDDDCEDDPCAPK